MILGVAWSTLGELTLRHLYLAGLPLLVGLLLSLPLGWLATRVRWLGAPIIAGTGANSTREAIALTARRRARRARG